MTMTELEERSGFQRSTIHLYIRCGLLHDPYRTSQTMAYYDESHLRRLEMIQKIKDNFLRTAKTSRVPLDFIKSQIEEDYMEMPGRLSTRKRPEQKFSEKKMKKREEIIEAALALYSKQGYYRTSIRDITKKVSISTPTFYHYFPDKRELFMKVIEYVITDWKEKSKAALRGVSDPTRRSTILFQTFQENYPRIGEVINHLKAGVVIGDSWAKKKLAQVYTNLSENIVDLTKISIEKGILRDMDLQLLSYFFFILDEAAVQRAALDDNYTVAETISFVTEMIVFGLMTEEGRKKWKKGIQKAV